MDDSVFIKAPPPLCFSFPVVVPVAGEQKDIKPLTGTAGQNITLHTGVLQIHGSSQVLWTYGPQKDVLLNFDDGKLEQTKSQRYHLDTNTGSLTIRLLNVNDTGLYFVL